MFERASATAAWLFAVVGVWLCTRSDAGGISGTHPAAIGGVRPSEVRASILVYHRFGPVVADSMTVRTRTFRRQLQYLRELGLRYLDVLLMGALIIIPAATAKRLATNLNGMLYVAVGVAVVATTIGTWLASVLQRETGPLIVSVAAGAFLVSLFRRHE